MFNYIKAGPTIDEGIYFDIGTYSFVVSGSTTKDAGVFACQIKKSDFGGSTAINSTFTVGPLNNTQNEACYSNTAYSVPANYFTWTQSSNQSGPFDINVYFVNSTYPNDGRIFAANAALYRGSVPNFNTTHTNNLCGYPFNISFVIGGRNVEGGFATSLQNVTLAAGSTYTLIVAGGRNDSVGYWGVTIDPTVAGTTRNSPGLIAHFAFTDAHSIFLIKDYIWCIKQFKSL
jgi:hypothetical protein